MDTRALELADLHGQIKSSLQEAGIPAAAPLSRARFAKFERVLATCSLCNEDEDHLQYHTVAAFKGISEGRAVDDKLRVFVVKQYYKEELA